MRIPARGSRKLSVPTATTRRARRRGIQTRRRRCRHRPCRRSAARPRRRRRAAGPAPPAARPAPRAAVTGREPADRAGRSARLQRVDQRDRVGAALLRPDRDRRRVGDVGRQLDDQRLRGQRPQGFEQGRRLGRLLADDQARVDVGAGDVELDRRHLLALRDPLDQARELLVAGAHHGDDQRHRQLGQLRQILGQEPVQTLVGKPDRVDHPRRRLPDPLRLVSGPRLRRDRLRDERRERKVLEQLVPEDAPRSDRIEGPGGVDHRMRQLDAAEVRAPRTTGPSTQRRM